MQAREKLKAVRYQLSIIIVFILFILIKEYFTLMVGFYKLWPAAQLFNFYFVPLKFRVNYTNVVSLAWNSYVGYIANRPVHKIKSTDKI